MRSLFILIALAACSEPAEQQSAPAAPPSSLVGLYERARIGGEPSRLCIVGEGQAHRFGLKSSTEGAQSCTMKGRVRGTRGELALQIDGDPACALTATVSGEGITLGQPRGAECGYYCGLNTELDAGLFAKVGATAGDARRAVDIAGESLC